MTALHAGWVEGVGQALAPAGIDGLRRVVVLSDGHANAGVCAPAAIAADVAAAVRDGVTTSTIGLGRGIDEHLLGAIAEAGGGSFTFVETPEQLEGLFEIELAGLSALRGRNVRLTFHGGGARFVAAGGAAGGGARAQDGVLHLPDLIAGFPREVLVAVEVDADLPALPPLRLAWDDVLVGAPAHLSAPLLAPVLPAAELDARPVDAAVAAAQRAADLVQRIAEVEKTVRRGDLAAAEASIVGLHLEVEAWPASPDRAAQLADLDQLLGTVRTRDPRMAEKRAYAARVDRERGELRSKKELLRDAERAWTGASRAAKGAAVAAPRPADVRGARPAASVEVVVGDLTDQAVDLLVNASDPAMSGGGGVDGAVHRRAGPELAQACAGHGPLGYGRAAVTPGFRLPAGHVAHVTTRSWRGGAAQELDLLRAAYGAAFAAARALHARTVALPAIGTGAYGYPVDAATEVAVTAALEALRQDPGLRVVRFVVADAATAAVYRRALASHGAAVAA
jgi:Ca-activated chloride channel family protein